MSGSYQVNLYRKSYRPCFAPAQTTHISTIAKTRKIDRTIRYSIIRRMNQAGLRLSRYFRLNLKAAMCALSTVVRFGGV
jgi:hypothetical protein